jgi:hypothetical protein
MWENRLCGLVVRVPGYRSRGPEYDSRALQKKVVGLERGPLSLVSTTEELLGTNSSGSGIEIREYDRRDSSRWPHGTLYPQKVGTNFADKWRLLWGHEVMWEPHKLGLRLRMPRDTRRMRCLFIYLWPALRYCQYLRLYVGGSTSRQLVNYELRGMGKEQSWPNWSSKLAEINPNYPSGTEQMGPRINEDVRKYK